ncbi:phosphopantetheine-binding protein [Paenibacillus mesotrionivorans]|uniref:Phosphopantetheine-binding protein n=1 Tax=Paenibacillus mesotrionivorans TaxID=3160968 RepID=A0ACC7NVG5_9BACL
MTREQIMNTLCELMQQNLEVKLPENVTEASRVYQDLFIDSIMVLQLIVYVEEEFGISVPEEDVDPAVFQTLGSLVTFIEELRQHKIA